MNVDYPRCIEIYKQKFKGIESQIREADENEASDLKAQLENLKELFAPIESRIKKDKDNRYEGGRQGDEVFLPAFKNFHVYLNPMAKSN
ncbi:MAG: hypothetical protein ACXVNF_13895 [Neobacillus sp.]